MIRIGLLGAKVGACAQARAVLERADGALSQVKDGNEVVLGERCRCELIEIGALARRVGLVSDALDLDPHASQRHWPHNAPGSLIRRARAGSPRRRGIHLGSALEHQHNRLDGPESHEP